MSRYKISDLENLSGIKAHTIRIWEQRYDILVPLRTESNIRYYDDAQLKKLLNVVSLINSGLKISQIGKLDDREISNRIEAIFITEKLEVKEELLINQLISSGLTYDEAVFDKAFTNAIIGFGLMQAYQKIIYPMLVKMGLLWSTNELNPAQEHFVSNLVRQKISAAIDSLTNGSSNNERWLLFLPQGEFHDLGLMVANYGLKQNGKKVFYLGDNVPSNNLIDVANDTAPTHFLTFAVRQNQEKEMNKLLAKIASEFTNSKFYVCCSPSFAEGLKLAQNQEVITSYNDYLTMLD